MQKRPATLKDIAEATGVSARAVSAALNNSGRVSEKTRQRIVRVAEEMNYRPNILARGLVQQKTYLLGALFPYASVSFFNQIISGIEQECTRLGYDLLLGNASLLDEREEPRALLRLLSRNVDGVLCAPDPRAHSLFQRFVGGRTPVIQVMTRVPDLALPYIGVDNVTGGYIATQYLLGLGHRYIGFLASERSWYAEINDRHAGYTRALMEAGVKMDPENYQARCDLTYDGGKSGARELLTRAPETTAIFATTDHAALGAVQAALDLGRRVPEGCSVIGYDDLELAERQIGYPLTTVAQPKEEVGVKAFELFRRASEGEPVESIVLTPKLVVRGTTAPVPDWARHGAG
ncbi:MAG: substrate-binding domain-containing protein [Spirochaetes bacterium]|jgi:DNA-binding LacI/PurR family transcriptional regulator|nr:substrate-binding domain-containing protein [Spirochaetota bacterium]